MPATKTYWWTTAPFLRLLPALTAGILAQWYFDFTSSVFVLPAAAALLILALFRFLPLSKAYRFNWLQGCCLYLLLAALGAALTWRHHIKNDAAWFQTRYQEGDFVVATLQEPLVAKQNAYKATALVTSLARNDTCRKANGRIIIYFNKDIKNEAALSYGSQVVFQKLPQAIRNSGNPGSFDYARYCLFQGISHQVFLRAEEYKLLPQHNRNALQLWLVNSRLFVVHLLQQYIQGEKEQGLAEALLIGYKDDLDKSLVQAYSNTGVVHVIAISGLHLGLIYALLLLLTKPLKHKKLNVLRFALVLLGLWAFALLAGAQPSVLRSAVMFSCLALGQLIDRRISVFNSLACSAFVLLCINPFWLWDAGFQLSYTAVLSILIFFRPVYNWLYFPNKILDGVWKLTAVTGAAQIFTLPVGLYYFHQFPCCFCRQTCWPCRFRALS